MVLFPVILTEDLRFDAPVGAGNPRQLEETDQRGQLCSASPMFRIEPHAGAQVEREDDKCLASQLPDYPDMSSA